MNCKDCNKELKIKGIRKTTQTRCISCYHKSRINIAHCKDCGKKLRHPANIRCAKCFGKHNSGENNQAWQGGLPNCKMCNNKISVYKNSNQYNTGICQKCYNGEVTKRWNPNLESEIRLKGRTVNPNYRVWRKEVLLKNGNVCTVCESVENLVVHHLNSFTKNKMQRTDISNGVVVCNNCHKTFHKLYGYTNNTKEQFEEYLLNLTQNGI